MYKLHYILPQSKTSQQTQSQHKTHAKISQPCPNGRQVSLVPTQCMQEISGIPRGITWSHQGRGRMWSQVDGINHLISLRGLSVPSPRQSLSYRLGHQAFCFVPVSTQTDTSERRWFTHLKSAISKTKEGLFPPSFLFPFHPLAWFPALWEVLCKPLIYCRLSLCSLTIVLLC